MAAARCIHRRIVLLLRSLRKRGFIFGNLRGRMYRQFLLNALDALDQDFQFGLRLLLFIYGANLHQIFDLMRIGTGQIERQL